MKKYLYAAFAAAVCISLFACGDKESSSTDQPESTTEAAVTDITETVTALTTASGTQSAASTSVAASADETNTTAANTEGSAAPSGGFRYTEDGAVAFSGDVSEQSDEQLIAAAQALFESACQTQWSFTVGSPYTLDTSSFITNQYGWEYYLITEEGINSVADVKADYHRIFSDRYLDALDEVFMDDGDHAYCLDGARGMNILYSYSLVTGISERSGDEIFFTVNNYYNGDGFGSDEPYYEEEEFSAVIDSGGVWRAGVFRLPY